MLTKRDPRAFPATLDGAEPGVNAAFVRLPSVCIICACLLIAGDWRWVCRDCWIRYGNRRLDELVGFERGKAGFSPQVTPVWAYSDVEE